MNQRGRTNLAFRMAEKVAAAAVVLSPAVYAVLSHPVVVDAMAFPKKYHVPFHR